LVKNTLLMLKLGLAKWDNGGGIRYHWWE